MTTTAEFPRLPALVATACVYAVADFVLKINDRYLVMFHTLLASVWVGYVLIVTGDLYLDRIFEDKPLCIVPADEVDSEVALMAYMAGFFVYDLMLCYKTNVTFAWYCHGAFSLLVYIAALTGWAQGYATRFVVYEWSSIFYQASREIDREAYKTIYKSSRVLFAVTFIVIRYIYGLPLSFAFQRQSWLGMETETCGLSSLARKLVLLTNVLFAVLNFYWGFLIVKSVVGKKDVNDGNEKNNKKGQ
mmetsp:Transcript_44683/g.71803  ORF Transcript_44683/g.71803 Transcript_44683/m.71803 type:complete len:246 (+) Transcript_44683:144-881(+)